MTIVRIAPALALVAIASLAPAAPQQIDGNHPFQPGELIRFGEGAYPPPGSVWEVVSCEPPGPYRDCDLRPHAPVREERDRPFMMSTYDKAMTLVGRAAPERATSGAAPAAAPARDRAGPVRAPATAAAAPAAGGSCPRSPYGGPVSGARPPSAALFQQKITDSITMAAYGPYWYGVRLSGFSVGGPIRNTVSTRPGVGAMRVNTGAPPGATMYPVSTTMSVCEGAPAGSSSWRTSQKRYLCFVSANNEWTCGASS